MILARQIKNNKFLLHKYKCTQSKILHFVVKNIENFDKNALPGRNFAPGGQFSNCDTLEGGLNSELLLRERFEDKLKQIVMGGWVLVKNISFLFYIYFIVNM